MAKLLQVTLTPEMAAGLSGAYMLRSYKNDPPTDPALIALLERENVPEWERHVAYCNLKYGAAKVLASLSAFAVSNGL